MIFRRIGIVLMVSVLALGCYKVRGPEKPTNLIPKDKMVDILLEIRLMSAATGKNQNVLHKEGIKTFNYIYDKFGIDSTQFAKSNDYYAFYIDEYDEIYDKVRDSLDALKKKFDALKEEEARQKVERDSLMAISRKDSLKLEKSLDSMELRRKQDSITERVLEEKFEEGLIEPVSDTDVPNL